MLHSPLPDTAGRGEREMTKTQTENGIRKRLVALSEPAFGDFQSRLLPTLSRETILGVRTPLLRDLAKELSGSAAADVFLTILPHRYFEEYNLHGFLIERKKSYDETVALLDAFLPYVDNWATSYLVSPKALGKEPARLREKIDVWTASAHPFTVRFGVGMLLKHFLDDRFDVRDAKLVASLCCGEYYVNMMIAWYFATALCKQPDAILPFFEQRRLPPWVHNKAIGKACESCRISQEEKQYLRSLK